MGEPTVGERAVALLVEHDYCTWDEVNGCTESDLDALEQRYGVALPEAYRSFMRHAGRYPGDLLAGSEFTYPAMRRQLEFAKRHIDKADTEFSLPDDVFVFRGLQGYVHTGFRTHAGEDPPVYELRELGPSEPDTYEWTRIADSFSEWLFERIERSSSGR